MWFLVPLFPCLEKLNANLGASRSCILLHPLAVVTSDQTLGSIEAGFPGVGTGVGMEMISTSWVGSEANNNCYQCLQGPVRAAVLLVKSL